MRDEEDDRPDREAMPKRLERRDGVALTQDDMAAAIGASRERVNKALADFERRGLITVNRRHVRIIDEKKLQQEIQA